MPEDRALPPALPVWIPLAVSVLALQAHAGGTDSSSTGRFEIRTLRFDHARHLYSVWLPPGFSTRVKWPAILFLHGSGECGADGLKPTTIGLGPALSAHPERWPMVVVFPQKDHEELEWEEREEFALKVLDHAIGPCSIDRHRVALVGVSQGAHGAWMVAAHHPERWTCVVAVAGYGRARTVSPRVARLPVWAFHGLRDDLVDPNDTRRIVAGIRDDRVRLGLDSTGVRMTLYPDANHNSWDPAFAETELPGWILGQPPTR
jgi:predicted peptidase